MYGFVNGTQEEFYSSMMEVFRNLRAAAGEEGHIYWRRPVEMSRDRVTARFCVLDKDWDDVTLPEDTLENQAGRVMLDVKTRQLEPHA